MIQDIAPHQYRNEYSPTAPDKESILLCYSGRNVLLNQDDKGIHYPTFKDAEEFANEKELYSQYTYLFTIDDVKYYLRYAGLGNELNADVENGYQWEDYPLLRTAAPKHLAFAGISGWQLYRWYHSRRFCGRCGQPMVHDEKERMMRCPECGLMEFPKICPAVIVAVTHGNKILMSKYAGREFKRYALIAGFNEIGETIEETVRREVMEEVGLKVKNIHYYKSQPWSFTDTLLLGFFCELDGVDEITLDEEELAMAEWFEREEMPVKAEDLSLTNEMMMAFKNGKR